MLMHPRRPKWTWWLCQQLGIARSVYFTWQQLQHDPGPRAQENAVITAAVLYVFNRHRGFYGTPRVCQELRAAGFKIGRHRIARLMRCSELDAMARRMFRPCQNPGNRASCGAENLLKQEFNPATPKQRLGHGRHQKGHIGLVTKPGFGAPPDRTRSTPYSHGPREVVPVYGIPAAAGRPRNLNCITSA